MGQLQISERITSDKMAARFASALPAGRSPDQFVTAAETYIAIQSAEARDGQPKLADCTPTSICTAMLKLAPTGLIVDGVNAYLIPYRDNKNNTVTAQLQIDYKGITQVLWATGLVRTIQAAVVWEGDVFDWDAGQLISHRPYWLDDREQGLMRCVYARVELVAGGYMADVMTRREVDAIRSRSKAKNFGPWKTDYAEMAKKTVLRRLFKLLPQQPTMTATMAADPEPVALQQVESPRGMAGVRARLTQHDTQPDEPAELPAPPPQQPEGPEQVDEVQQFEAPTEEQWEQAEGGM